MADIREPCLINTLIENHDFVNCNAFPASNYAEKDSFVVTTSKNTVSLIKLTDTKPFKSWSAKQNQPFTCPVVFDKSTNLLCSVQKLIMLRRWSIDSESIDSEKPLKVSAPVHQFISLNNGSTLVVFATGDCALLNKVTEKSGTKQVVGKGEKIVRVQAVVGNDVITVLYQINAESAEFYLVSFSLNSDESELQISKQTLKNKELKLNDWSLITIKDKPSLYTLWENGEILKHPIPSFDTATSIKTLPLNKKWIYLRLIDATHAVVVNSESEIQIWDLRFNVCKTKRRISLVVDKSSQLSLLDETLLVLSGNQIYSCGVRVLNTSLASAIGKNVDLKEEVVFVPALKKIKWGSDLKSDGKGTEIGDMEVDVKELNPRSTTVICKDEIHKTAEKKDVKAMMNLLQNYKDIPEPEIATILKFILETDEKHFKDIDVEFLFKNDLYSEQKTSCILRLMQTSFNDVFLYQDLKKISSQDTLILLKFLHLWLKENLLVYNSIDKELKLSQGVTWINILLDSHYNDFLMMKGTEIQEFLMQLSETVNDYFKTYEAIDELANVIQTILNGKKVPQARAQGQYQVEVLIL